MKFGAVVALGFISLRLVNSEPIKISTITDASSSSSAETVKAFRQKIAEHPTVFKLVPLTDASTGLIFQTDCINRTKVGDSYVCFYTLHYAGMVAESFMGGGVNATNTADEMAAGFLSSIAQDISEKLTSTTRGDAINNLQACLFLTQSSCAVPEVLVPELKTRTLNLSQYLQRGGLKK